MAVRSQVKDDKVYVTIMGTFNFNSHTEFRKELLKPEFKNKHFVVDLSGTRFMDSSALGMLLMLREQAGDKPVELCGATGTIENIIKISNFDKLFKIS